MITLLCIFVLGIIICFFAFLIMEDDDLTSNTSSASLAEPKVLPAIPKVKTSAITKEPESLKELLLNKEAEPKTKKIEIDSQKLKDFSDILRAIGFSASEAKQKVTKLLTENPDATEIELLRKATDR